MATTTDAPGMVDCPNCEGQGEIVVGHNDPQQVQSFPCSWCGCSGQVTPEAAEEWQQRKQDYENP